MRLVGDVGYKPDSLYETVITVSKFPNGDVLLQFADNNNQTAVCIAFNPTDLRRVLKDAPLVELEGGESA